MASWRAMVLRSLRQNSSIPTRNYVQLATVKESGAPSNRTIVFRGFLGESDELTFVTDTRSCKVEEVKHNQMAELCWYFPISREQYRIAGQLKIIAHDHTEASLLEARQQAWQRLSDNGRLQFTWPPPGAKRESDAVFDGPAPAAEVDYLSLRSNTRQKFQRDAGADSAAWTATNINP